MGTNTVHFVRDSISAGYQLNLCLVLYSTVPTKQCEGIQEVNTILRGAAEQVEKFKPVLNQKDVVLKIGYALLGD